MKLNPERQLCVLGFTKASAVKHQCLIGSSVQVVVGPPDDEVGALLPSPHADHMKRVWGPVK